jgi:hypothetical protein
MGFINGEKIITAQNIKTESGEIIKCAEEVYITHIRPDLIQIQWNKDKRELNALTPPDTIFKYTESNKEIADNRKAFFDVLAMEKYAIEVNRFLELVKEYWDKNKEDVKAALEYIGKSVKSKLQDFAGQFDKLYNGLKGIIGIEYSDTLAEYIPDLAAGKVAKVQQKILRTSENIDKILLAYADDYIVEDKMYDAILYKLSNLVGGLYPYDILEKTIPTITEYSDGQKAIILKLSKLADNYKNSCANLPLAFMDREDYKIAMGENFDEKQGCEIADKYDINKKKLKTKQIVKEKDGRPSDLIPAKGAQPEFAEVDRMNADPNSNSGHFF